MKPLDYDVVIAGGGHNALVAATYLAKAGKSVLILEKNPEIGGATASVRAFPEFDAHVSRYSYLVSLLPDQIIRDLGVNFVTLPRTVSSYTPYSQSGSDKGLYIARDWNKESEDSFRDLTGDEAEGKAWQEFYTEISQFAKRFAPTMLQPLKSRRELRSLVNMPATWDFMIENPIGQVIQERFASDLVRGVVLTDALIGTHISADSLQANRCFLYHLVGNGTGEWRVPRGGMGALVLELERVALAAGVVIQCNSPVIGIYTDADHVQVEVADGQPVHAQYLLANLAPQVLAQLRGDSVEPSLDGSQMKINMLVKKLPRLKSGDDPHKAFSGTFHINESYSQLEHAYHASKNGQMPPSFPSEIYCHTVTDPSILSPELQSKGFHTLTLFGIHTPASLFDDDAQGARDHALQGTVASLNHYLLDPIESVLATNSDGSLCIEAKSPLDLEEAIGLPRGNIFHQDLTFPFREDDDPIGWGVETDDPRIFICGAGAVRGGGVSGIPGHNAAMAVLAKD